MGEYDNWWIDTHVRGLRFRVDVDHDPEAAPFEADCYDDEQVEAWKRDRWEYVIVTVTPEFEGELIAECADSLSSVEAGDLPGAVNDHIGRDELNEYPVKDMIAECTANMRGKQMTHAINRARATRRGARREVEQLRELRRAVARA